MSPLSWENHARDRLRGSGGRTGGARDTVISYLAAQDCCLFAQEIFDGLRADGRPVGIASVYRVLTSSPTFASCTGSTSATGSPRFEPAHPGGEHHHHLVCGECGKVDTFDDLDLEPALHRVAGGHGYALDEHDVVLRGSCSDCRV